MNFERPMTIQLTGPEVATVYTALTEMAAKYSHELLKKMETIDAAQEAQDTKVPGPDLHMVSAA